MSACAACVQLGGCGVQKDTLRNPSSLISCCMALAKRPHLPPPYPCNHERLPHSQLLSALLFLAFGVQSVLEGVN